MHCRKRSNILHEGCTIKCDRSRRWLATAGQVILPQKKWRSMRDMAMATRLSGISQGPRLRIRTENMWLPDALCQKSPRVRALEHWELAICGNGYSGLMTCLFRTLSRLLWPCFCASRKVNGHFHFQARPATHSIASLPSPAPSHYA